MQRAVMVMDVLILKWCDKTGSACEGCDIDIWTDLSFSVSSPSLSLFSHKNKMGYQPYDHVETVPIKSPSNPTRVGDPWFFHQWLLPFLFLLHTHMCGVYTEVLGLRRFQVCIGHWLPRAIRDPLLTHLTSHQSPPISLSLRSLTSLLSVSLIPFALFFALIRLSSSTLPSLTPLPVPLQSNLYFLFLNRAPHFDLKISK